MNKKEILFNLFRRYLERKNIEGKIFLEGYTVRNGFEYAKVHLCPPGYDTINIPKFIKYCDLFNYQILSDEFKDDGSHGYTQYHEIRININNTDLIDNFDKIKEEILCKQLD